MLLLPTSLVFCLLAAEPAAAGKYTQVIPTTEPRTLAVIAKDLSSLLKQEATAKNLAERSQAVFALTELYAELMHDPRLETNDFVKNYRGELFNRLVRTRDDLKRQIALEQRRTRVPRPAAKDVKEPREDEADLVARQSLAVTLATADYTTTSANLAFARGGQAVIADNGQALVELIERTINPAFWDSNGGPGTIFYYAPLRCLVVNATGPIHEEIGGVIGGLQGAGQ